VPLPVLVSATVPLPSWMTPLNVLVASPAPTVNVAAPVTVPSPHRPLTVSAKPTSSVPGALTVTSPLPVPWGITFAAPTTSVPALTVRLPLLQLLLLLASFHAPLPSLTTVASAPPDAIVPVIVPLPVPVSSTVRSIPPVPPKPMLSRTEICPFPASNVAVVPELLICRALPDATSRTSKPSSVAIVALVVIVTVPRYVLVPDTFTRAPVCPVSPLPASVRVSLPTVMPPSSCSVAPSATVVPPAVVPKALSCWMFSTPSLTSVAPV